MTKKTFRIEGMTCASCAVNIEKCLNKIKGVEKASVNFANKSAQIDYNEKITKDKELSGAITKAGYTPVDMALRDIEFKVVGMSSEHCAGIVKTALEKVKGVKEVETNFANSFAKVKYEQGVVKISDMKKAIDDAGYEGVITE